MASIVREADRALFMAGTSQSHVSKSGAPKERFRIFTDLFQECMKRKR